MWLEKEEEGCWPDELGQIEGDMLIPRMKAMGREIAGLQIIEEIVQWRNDRVGKEIRPAHGGVGIK